MSDRSTGAPRLLRSAVATSALPMLMLGSAVVAAPAAADVPRQALAPRSATPVNIEAAQVRLASASLASSVPAAFTAPTTTRASRSAASYTVKSGDTLYGIATRHGIGLSALLQANGLSQTSVIHPGQTLKLSGSASSGSTAGASGTTVTTHTVKSGDTLYGIATRHGIGLSALLQANGLSESSIIHPGQTLKLSGSASSGSTAGASGASSYTVKSGDTLSGIASRHGIGLSALLQANGMSQTSVIHPGQTLKLSGTASADQGVPGEDLVPNTFLHYTYPDHVVASANENKRALLSAGVPSRSQMQAIIADTARRMGVDPSLALAHAFVESSFNHASVSPANAIGAMQVIPSSGAWASELVGRKLDLMDPRDNAVAGIAIIRQLQRTAPSMDDAIAGYYQGLGGVTRDGMRPDTKQYVTKVKTYLKRF
ncbi:MAG TPA: LysM peptidoglycan-binding domain-containing protein [Citricoccus sp.]